MSVVLINHAPDGGHASVCDTGPAALDTLSAMLVRTPNNARACGTATARRLALLNAYGW